MNVTATYTHDSVMLTAQNLSWQGDGGTVKWELTCPTSRLWGQSYTTRVVKQQPESLSYTFTNLDPNTQYQWKVTQATSSVNVESGTVTTSDLPGRFSCVERTASSLKFAFTQYAATSYARVAKFYYSRYDTDKMEECGSIDIPANSTSTDVSVLIKNLRNNTMYNAKMEMYKKETWRNTLIKKFVASARTGIPSSESPSVTLEDFITRYDTHTIWMKCHTDYEGDHRFVLFLKEYVNNLYWHHLVLPLNEDTFYSEDIVTELEAENPDVNHTDYFDIKVGLIVESDTKDIESKGFTYPIGNALDIPELHTDMPEGMTVYGDMRLYPRIGFHQTPVLSYEEGAPFSVAWYHVSQIAYSLINKFETLYKKWTYEEWVDFAFAHETTYAFSVVPKHTYPPNPMHNEPPEITRFKNYIQEMHTRCESVKALIAEAQSGLAVFASTGRLVKEMEVMAHRLSTNPDWSSEDAIDADPGEAVDNEYFMTLADIVRDII